MKRTFAAIALLGASAMSAQAVEVVWQGDIFVKTVSGTCVANGITDSTFYRGVFKPHGLADNGTVTKLALIGTRNATRYSIDNKGFVAGTYDGVFIGSTANYGTFTSAFTATSSAPASPTMTTQTVVLKAKIANFANFAGCTATIIGSMGLRP